MLPSRLDYIRKELREFLSEFGNDAITDEQADRYINKAFFKIPNQEMVHELDTTYRFSTIPNVGKYNLQKLKLFENEGDEWNLIDKYYRLGPRVTVNGCPIAFYTSREKFLCSICDNHCVVRATGKKIEDRITVNIGKNVVPESVTVYLKDECSPVIIKDKLVSQCKGSFTYENSCRSYDGSIDYLTGDIDVKALTDSDQVEVIYTKFKKGKPCKILFYGMTLELFPVPDKHYQIEMEATMYPTALLQDEDTILIREWEDFIVAEAARLFSVFKRDKEGIAIAEYQIKKAREELLQKEARYLMEGSTSITRQCYCVCSCGGGGGCCGN